MLWLVILIYLLRMPLQPPSRGGSSRSLGNSVTAGVSSKRWTLLLHPQLQPRGFTQSQHSWSWKGALKMTQSNIPTQSQASWSRLLSTVSCQILTSSKDGEATTSLGNLFHCSINYREKQMFSSCVDTECPPFQLALVASCPSMWHDSEESVSTSFTPSHQLFIHIVPPEHHVPA